ncbi:hypothetical protein B0T17DRAFT_620874 [Bombardia bombarda]|uniref:Uncharacterized protein n=1 Tax=Bombardia bombarda TaxID=252184 RepID=A0AA39WAK0_9PEZI|nr:hypothetical protein B0T17DRAFT_620874 [Bombardia bombarda]
MANPEKGYHYSTSVPTNMMSFKDGNGVIHQIHIPAGRADEALTYFKSEEWNELVAKFPKWENQPYTDEFYIITKWKVDALDDDEGVIVKKAGDPLVLNEQGEVVLSEINEE